MKLTHFLLILILASACSKSKVEEAPAAPNLPPESFTVVVDSIYHNSAQIVWLGALDPEQEKVVYDIYLNDKLVAADTSNLRFELRDLKEMTLYSGKIVAKDTRNNKTTATFSFTTEKYFFTFFKSYQYGLTETEYREGDAKNMIRLSDGNYLVVGAYFVHVPYRNDAHIFAFKFDYEGKEIWRKTYPYPVANDVAVSECSDGILLASHINVLKIGNDGNLIWQKKIVNFDDNDGGSEIKSVTSDSYGNIFIGGGRIDPHPDRMQQAVVVKLDASGNTIWEKSLNNTLYSFFYDLKMTVSDELIAFGMREGNGITVQQYVDGEHYQSDFWLVKFSKTGDIVWQKSYGDEMNDSPFELIVKANGNYVFVGSSEYTGYDRQGSIYEIAPDGNELWKTSYGPGMSMTLGVAETLDGGVVTTGFSDLGGPTQMTLHKFSNARKQEWEKTYSVFGSIMFGRSVIAEKDGGFRVAVSEVKYAGGGHPPHILVYKTNDRGGVR